MHGMTGTGGRRQPSPARTLLAVALAATLALGACGSTGPTAAPATSAPPTAAPPTGASGPPATAAPGPDGPDAAAAYAAIRAQVEAIRGLRPSGPVEPVTIDATQLRTNLETEFDAEHTAAGLADAEALLIALGLLPPGSSLRALTLDFQAGQVAGYYSTRSDELFVVSRSGVLDASALVTYAHEFTHQLQDQRFDLDGLGLDAADQSDRTLARLALIEGDATSVQTTWSIENLDARQLGELLGAALDPAALEALARAPAYLRETALFPYQDGLTFVSQLIATGGYAAVDRTFAEPPASTEQILHPEAYLAGEEPITVALPDGLAAALGTSWQEAGRDTLGELLLRIWLATHGVTAVAARDAAAGWGGDRLALFRGPGDAIAVVLDTRWDSGPDADGFAAAAATALAAGGAGGQASRVVHEAGTARVVVLIGPSDAIEAALAALGG